MTQTKKIDRDLLGEGFPSADPHHFTVEASDIGLAPGEWPDAIEVPGIGNGQPFLHQLTTSTAVRYRQAFGCIDLLVYND